MLAPEVKMRVSMSEWFLPLMSLPLMAEIMSLLCNRPSHLSAGLSGIIRVIIAPAVPNEYQTKPNHIFLDLEFVQLEIKNVFLLETK